jgi:hypothetical protein
MKYLLAFLPFLTGTTSGQLVVHSPKSLVDLFPAKGDNGNNGLIDCNYANFGFVPYGHSMVSHFKY